MNNQKYLPRVAVLILVVVLTMIGPFSTDMYLPALPDIVRYFGTTDAILNMTLYGFLFFQAIGILFLGTISDKYGRKPVLVISIIVYIVSSLLASVSPDITVFIANRMLQGAASGGMMVISVALIKDCFEERIRNRVLTISIVLSVIGPVASPVIGAYLIEAINWQSTLVFPGVLATASLIMALLFTESLPPDEKFTGTVAGVLKNMVGLCKNKSFTAFLVAMCMFSLPFMAYLSVSSYIFVEGFGLKGTTYSYLLALNAILGTIGMIIIQRITRALSMRKTAPKNKIGDATEVIVIIFSLISGVFMLTVSQLNAIICFIGMTFCVIAAFASRPYALGVLMKMFKKDTGAVSSLFNFAMIFVGCIGMIVGTLPWPQYTMGLGVCSIIAGVISFACLLIVKRENKI